MENTDKLCIRSLSKVVKEAIDKIYPSNYCLEPSQKYPPLTCSRTAFIEEWIRSDTDLYNAISKDIKTSANRSDFINAVTTPNHISKRQYKKRLFESFLFIDIASKVDSYATSLKSVIRDSCYYYNCQQRYKYSRDIEYSLDIDHTIETDVLNGSLPYEDSVRKFMTRLIGNAVVLAKNDSCLFPTTGEGSESNYLLELLDSKLIGDYEKLALITFLALIPKGNDFGDFKEDVQKDIISPLYYKYCVNILKKEDIWNAGKHWYEQSKIEGNRFSKLFPETTLLPLAGTMPIYVHSENKPERRLMDVIKETPGHLFLIGEGGIGKTTALYSIMEASYSIAQETEEQRVPLFIELSRAYNTNDFDLERGASLYILHSIQKQLQESLKTNIDLSERIETAFMMENDVPEYVLLLDGLNEVSREKINGHEILGMVVAEIDHIMANYQNVRVILTSRSEEKLKCNAKSLYISGIEPTQIEKYMIDKKVSESKIKRTKENTQLMEVLRVPLFLTMYIELDGDNELLSRGEIIHLFFSETNKKRYSEKDRINTINIELAKDTRIDRSEGSKNCITPHVLSFILDFITPQIAWLMANENKYQISRFDIDMIIKQVLSDNAETSFCSDYGNYVFNDYLSDDDENIRTTRRRIRTIFGKGDENDWDSICSGVLKCLTKQFGLLITNDYKEYNVLHQHIRDYFAALYHINKLRLATYINKKGKKDLAIKCLSEWAERPLPRQISIFIGEALGEIHNASDKQIFPLNHEDNNIDRTLIQRTLNIYRKRLSKPEIETDGFAIWNLFQILKLVRNNLSNADFSYLNLTNCCANGHKLGPNTVFLGARICDNFFLPIEHLDKITFVTYSPDGKYLLTASADGSIKIWDAKSMFLLHTLDEHTYGIHSAEFSTNSDYLLTSDEYGTFLWDTEEYQIIDRLYSYGSSSSAHFSPDGLNIITSFAGKEILVLEKQADSSKYSYKKLVRIVHDYIKYSQDGKYLLTSNTNGKYIYILDANTLDLIYIIKSDDWGICSPIVCPNEKEILIKCIPPVVFEKNLLKINIYDYKKCENHCINTELGHSIYTIGIELDSFTSTIKFVGEVDTFNPFPNNQEMSKIIAFTSDTVSIINVNDFTRVKSFKISEDMAMIESAFYGPNTKYIITILRNGTVSIRDPQYFTEVYNFNYNSERVVFAKFCPDENYLAIESSNEITYLWDCEDFYNIKEVGTLIYPSIKKLVSKSSYGHYFVTVQWGEHDKQWDAKTDHANELLSKNTEWVHNVFYQNYNALGFYYNQHNNNGYVFVSSPNTNKVVGILEGHSDLIWSATFSLKGNYIVTSSRDNTAMIWNIQYDSEKDVYTFPLTSVIHDNDGIQDAELNDEETRVLTVSNGIVKIWDMKNPSEKPRILNTRYSKACSAHFSPKGNYIVTVSTNGYRIRIWDAKDYHFIHEIPFVPGLDIWNLDLTNLDDQSSLHVITRELLSIHGAKLYDCDKPIHHDGNTPYIDTDSINRDYRR